MPRDAAGAAVHMRMRLKIIDAAFTAFALTVLVWGFGSMIAGILIHPPVIRPPARAWDPLASFSVLGLSTLGLVYAVMSITFWTNVSSARRTLREALCATEAEEGHGPTR